MIHDFKLIFTPLISLKIYVNFFQTAELCYAESSGDVNEDFLDPTRKTPCTCAKWVPATEMLLL